MMNGLVSVNDAKLAVEQNGSLTAVIGSASVYDKKHSGFARKKEVNVKVVSSDSGDLLIRNMPLFDEHDLKEMTNQSGCFKYVHIGCITVSIEPLIHQKFLSDYGKGIKGVCIIFDSTFEDFKESIICAHKFDLSEGRADFICYPNHCLSASDTNLSERLSVLLCMDNIRVKKGNEMMTLCIGHITSGTNTLNPQGDTGKTMKTVEVTGATEIEIKDLGTGIVDRLLRAREEGVLDVEPIGGSCILRPQRSGIKRYLMRAPKVVVRRNYNTVNHNEPSSSKQRMTANVEPGRKSFSAPTSPSGPNIMADRYYLDGPLVRNALRSRKNALKSVSSRFSG